MCSCNLRIVGFLFCPCNGGVVFIHLCRGISRKKQQAKSFTVYWAWAARPNKSTVVIQIWQVNSWTNVNDMNSVPVSVPWSAKQYNRSFYDGRLLDAAYRCVVSTCAPWQCWVFAAIFLDHHVWIMSMPNDPKRSNLGLVLAQMSLVW